jgi:hypothetical protein
MIMPRKTGIKALTRAQDTLQAFAEAKGLDIQFFGDKVVSSNHYRTNGNAIECKKLGDFNMSCHPDYLKVGVHHDGMGCCAAIMTTNPQATKQELIEYLRQN